MTTQSTIGFPEAARHLGVPLRVLRHAIRSGRVPAPPQQGATAAIPTAWLDKVAAQAKAAPKTFSRAADQKVPNFARYEGTSAWRKFRKRVHAYAWSHAR